MKVYNGELQKMVYIHCDVVAMMNDKVEKADATHTLAATSTIHRRFGITQR